MLWTPNAWESEKPLPELILFLEQHSPTPTEHPLWLCTFITYPGLNTLLSYFRGTSEHRWSSRGSITLAGWGFFAFLYFRVFLKCQFLACWLPQKLICFCNVLICCVTTNYWNKPFSFVKNKTTTKQDYNKRHETKQKSLNYNFIKNKHSSFASIFPFSSLIFELCYCI